MNQAFCHYTTAQHQWKDSNPLLAVLEAATLLSVTGKAIGAFPMAVCTNNIAFLNLGLERFPRTPNQFRNVTDLLCRINHGTPGGT